MAADVRIQMVAELKSDIEQILKRATKVSETFGKKTTKSMTDVQKATRKMNTNLKAATPIMAKLGIQAALAAAAFLAIRGAMLKGKEAVFGMNAEIETATIQFSTFLGSAEKAEEKVASLFEFAKTTPFETGPIIKASRQLQVFGGDVLNSDENLRLFGDAAAATSAPIDNLTFWIGRMYSSIKGGKPFGEAAMRLQELAVMTPEARTEMEDLQKSGASADEVFGAFQKSIEKFSGSMEIQSKTWKGVTSTFKDSTNIVIAEAFKPLFDSARASLKEINDWLSGPEVANGVQNFRNNLEQIPIKVIDLQIAMENFRYTFVKVFEGAKGPISKIAGFFGGLINVTSQMFKGYFEKISEWWSSFGETPRDVAENIKTAFSKLPQEIELVFLKMINFIQEQLELLPQRIVNFFTSMGNTIQGWWESIKDLDWASAGAKIKEVATAAMDPTGATRDLRIQELEEELAGGPGLIDTGLNLGPAWSMSAEEMKKAWEEGSKNGAAFIEDIVSTNDEKHEAKIKQLNDDKAKKEEELKESIDGLTEAVTTANENAEGSIPSLGGTGGDDGDGGDDGEDPLEKTKTALDDFKESLARTIGEAFGSGNMGSAQDQIKSLVADYAATQIGAAIGGPVGIFATSALKSLFGRKKKKVEKPIPVKVVNWGDMTQEFLKTSTRRNVSPMITTGGNMMMSSNFGREARI